MRRKTTEEFKTEVYDAVGDEYTVLGDYVNANTKILIKHEKCGYEYSVKPSNFQTGSRCPQCAFINQTLTQEDFEVDVYNSVGDEYTVLGQYKNNRTKILMRHEKCGYNYFVRPHDFKKGSRCPECAKKEYGKNLRMTQKQFEDNVYAATGSEYTVLGDYVNSQTKILIRHEKCNYEYSVTPNSFQKGCRCPKCANENRNNDRKMTLDKFKQRVFEAEGNNYIVVGEYINSITPIAIKHNVCGKINKTTPGNFLHHNARCSECSKTISKGVSKINKFLRKRNVNFTVEKTYDNLRDTHFLRYDFYLETNENIHCLIEFDGAQHFKPAIWDRVKDILTQKEKAIEKLLLQHEHDMMKEEYAEKNKIPLLRIRYDQVDKIENMIDDLLAHPKKYIYRHNTYLTQEEYWAPFEKSMKKIRPKYSTACA